MQYIRTASDLQASILEMENRQIVLWDSIQGQIHTTLEELTLLKIIKNVISKIASPPQADKKDLFDMGLGFLAGYISKQVLIGRSKNPIRLLLGTFLHISMGKFVSNNTHQIKSILFGLIHKLIIKKGD